MTTDLLNHIRNLNAKAAAWVAEDPKNRMAGILVEEAEYWNRMGIITVEQFKHYNLVCEAFESIRSAYGYKPSWSGLDGMTDEALKAEIKICYDQFKADERLKEAEELAHKQATEKAMAVHSGWSIGELISA